MLVASSGFVTDLIAQVGSHQESAKSVVKIMSRFSGGKVESGSGFVWSQADYVVTALHVVAGALSITVYSETLKKEREADIIAVHQESDLALLKLKTNDLALAPLKLSSAPPNLKEEHYIWGYPRDVNSMQGDDIRFSLSLNQQPTLGNIFKSQAHFESVVGKQGYPQYQAKILRVSSSIQPGHSGAPIFDKSGVVVGIGDGGLHQGIARINWAIPAQTYLAGLPASKDPKPAEPSRQANLYSAPLANPVEVKIGAGKKGTAQSRNGGDGQHALYLAWSAPLSDILETAEEGDAKDIQALELPDLSQVMIDVYEDHETGATIAVPQGTTLSFNPEDRMVEARSASGQVRMFVQIVDREGAAAKEKFDLYLAGLQNWRPDPEEQDELFEEGGYSELTKSRVTFDDNGELNGQLLVTLILDENNFLGTAVMADDLEALSPEDWNLFKLMISCVELADFAID
jgi:hypothetical protein